MKETELFCILDCVDSTNNYAMGQVHAGLARHGQAWMAKEQTGGKGQRGKKWETGKNENIALSIAVVPSGLKPMQQFRLSVAVALGCYDFFYEIAGNETTIKWPNDIYWGDRKAGGILIENLLQGNVWKYAVIGIGINVNQEIFSRDIKNPTSLKLITNNSYDPVILAQVLRSNVMARINSICNTGFEDLLSEYNLHLYKRNSQVFIKKGEMIFETKILGVTNKGKLRVERTGENEFDFGEVEWLLPS